MNAYLKLVCFSLHHVRENDYLITAGYFHLDKDRASQCHNLFYNLVLRKSLFKKKNLSLCLGDTLPLYLYLRIFHCQTNFPNFRSASNQNNFKVLSPLCFSQDLQHQNRLQSSLQNFNLQIPQLEILENKYTIGF